MLFASSLCVFLIAFASSHACHCARFHRIRSWLFGAEDESETKHLQAMDGANSRLRLFQMDLLEPASIRPAVEGARGVFHVASPVILHRAQDPEAIRSFLHIYSGTLEKNPLQLTEKANFYTSLEISSLC